MGEQSAVSGASSVSNGDQGDGGSDASQGGEVVNFRDLYERQQGELNQTKEQTTRLQRDFSNVQKQNQQFGQTIDRLKSALTGEDENNPRLSPTDQAVAELESEMDQYIQAAVQAERDGRPIPLTANAAIKSLKFQIQYLREKEENDREMKELKRQLAAANNPQKTIDQTAYSNMDSNLITALKTIYGPEHEIMPHFKTIGDQLSAEIKDLQKTEPEKWDRIRRDPQAQRNMVNYFVEKHIPPRARQLLQEDQIRRTPLSPDEVLNAYREAKQLLSQDPQNPQHRKHVDQLREEVLTRLFTKNMPGTGTKMSDMY